MNKFKIGDKVRVYECYLIGDKISSSSDIGIIKQISDDCVQVIYENMITMWHHYKQCELIERPREFWISPILKNSSLGSFKIKDIVGHISDYNHEGWIKFVEVKE